MRHARTSSKQVRDFEDMCEREEIDTPTLTIEPDLSEPPPPPPMAVIPNADEFEPLVPPPVELVSPAPPAPTVIV